MFAVNHGAGEKLPAAIAAMLDPVNKDAIHYYDKDKTVMPELHYHKCDEYWMWTKGRTRLTLRLPDGRSDTFEIGPGWVAYLVRGLEHRHEPLEDWACYEFQSEYREGCSGIHLHRNP